MRNTAGLKKTPTSAELMEKLLEKDPLLEMYQCGKRNEYKDIPGDLDATDQFR